MPIAQNPKCPHCGAKVRRDWQSCWLCGLELPANAPLAAGPALTSTTRHGDAAGRTVSLIVRIVGGLIALVLALIFIGLFADGQYGGAIGLIVLLLPAGLVTLTKALKRQSEGEGMSTAEKFGTFLLSLAVTMGAIVALSIAACVALFIACIAILSTGGLDFR